VSTGWFGSPQTFARPENVLRDGRTGTTEVVVRGHERPEGEVLDLRIRRTSSRRNDERCSDRDRSANEQQA
jgi:hypothetical protein